MSEDVLERRKQLLRQRLIAGGIAAPAPVMAAAPRTSDRNPLSDGQRRMWFLQTRDRDDTTLNVGVAYRRVGPIDTERLHAAFTALVLRHEILRTTYAVDDEGEPFQIATPDGDLIWQEHDLTELPATSRERRLEVLIRREYGRSFDLAVERPLRISLVRTGPDQVVLVLVTHHIAWDDDSWSVFFADVNAAYASQAPLPTLAAQFVDVEVLGAADRSAAEPAELDYWRSQLQPLPEPLELPAGRSGAASKRSETVSAALSLDAMTKVDGLARKHSATSFMVLLAAFEAVVNRYTASSDFLISVPVTDRRGAADSLIGYFGNSLLVRAQFDPRVDFDALVDTTRETCVGAFAHQKLGIDRVIRAVNPGRVAGRDGLAGLVELSFSARIDRVAFEFDGVAVTQLDVGNTVSQEPLAFMVVFGRTGTHVEAHYQRDVLERTVVEQFLDNYVRFLDAALADPSLRICDVDMLGESGRGKVLSQSHGVLTPPRFDTLTAMFEAQAANSRDRIAITSDTEKFTYGALNARANRLAHWLIAQEVGPEDIVALQMTNSVEFVVAVLGVLKSGGAYLPIDPAYPRDRIDYLIDDAKPQLHLTLDDLVAAETAAAFLSEADPTDSDRRSPLRSDNLAYVIYTSGSTGKPKGVQVGHGAIAEHLESFNADFGMTADDRLLQSSSVSFDASLLDIFVTLTLGARLVVPKPNAFRDVRYVADVITAQGVTVLHMVPSMLSSFLLLPEVRDWHALRFVPVGGEALPGEVCEKFASIFDATLRNHYGPTEAIVSSTHYAVEEPQGTRIVPIGTPNRNVYLYLLDDALQLVPTGVVGEIYLGGDQVARGYLDRRGLTAERFVADPFHPGGRIYRSGDLARRNTDGDLEFVGRSDQQVKVRGFRIELGEVEAAIAAHDDVAHCVVIATERPEIGSILVAYVVPAAGVESIDADEVKTRVAATLPEHMVPTAVLTIDEIPITAHGKLDRAALPEPMAASAAEHRAPSTPTEVRLAALFARILGRDTVGADDSFFELGGHSLLATRLVAKVRTEFNVDIDVRTPFDTPTVVGLASVIDAEAMIPKGAQRPPITRRDRPERVPLSYSQLAMWFQRRLEGPSAVGNIPLAVRIDGPLDEEALVAAIGDVVERNESLRTTFPEHDGIPFQRVNPAASVVVGRTQLDGDQERLDRELAEAAQHSFAVESEPLFRPHLFTLTDDVRVLSLLVHHMVADHWSFDALFKDLATAYAARRAGSGAPDWPDRQLQYADYAIWQRELFDKAPGTGAVSGLAQRQIDYWRTALAGAPDEIVVAHDRPRPASLGMRGAATSFSVPAELRERLKATAELVGTTEFMVYQAALGTLLHKLGAGDNVPVGTPIAGRVDAATDDLIGLFANIVVLRTEFTADPTVRTILSRVRDDALGAYSNQDIPVERLVEALNPPRTRSRNPLFQVMLHFRETAPDRVDLAGSALTVLPFDFDIAYLDVSVSFFADAEGGFDGGVILNTDLYDEASGQEFADRLLRVLTSFADDVDAAVRDVDVLTRGERVQLLEWGHANQLDLEAASTAPDLSVDDLAQVLFGGSDPIRGRPAPGVRALVLDSAGRLVPRGVVGELYLGGSGQGDRVFRSGVRARWESDGVLVLVALEEKRQAQEAVLAGAAATDTERRLIELLEELLDIEDVGREDGFFALGGDSVISIQWAGRATQAGLPLTPQMVFEYLTIAELATAIDRALDSGVTAEKPAEPIVEQSHAPMAVSGLSEDALAMLGSAWQARQ